jgi:hypothetical protein
VLLPIVCVCVCVCDCTVDRGLMVRMCLVIIQCHHTHAQPDERDNATHQQTNT